MNTPCRAWTAFALLALLPAAALAQGGKIDDVERSARESGGSSDDEDGSDCNLLCHLVAGFVHGSGHAAHHPDSVLPPSQTYGRYPWGGPRRDERFVTRGSAYRPRFGVTGVSWFKDAASSLGGIALDLEGGFEDGYLALHTTMYRERTAADVDYLWHAHAVLGGVAQMGRGFFTGGLGGRVVCLDTDVCAGGLDLAVGARVLPARPLILSADASLGGMKWHEGSWFLVTEYNTSASVLLGRVEIGGGWHWLKLGSANAFGGPMLIGRVWF